MAGKIKTDPDAFYRVIHGDSAYQDILDSRKVRTNAGNKPSSGSGVSLKGRPTAFPSFSKGEIALRYAESNPNHYVIATKDPSIKPSTSGRHGKGSTMFPTGKDGKHLTELPADKVDVYKHVGKGQYKKVLERGAVPAGKKAAVKSAAKAGAGAVKAGAKFAAKRVLPPLAAYQTGKAIKEGRYRDAIGAAAWLTAPTGVLYETAKMLPKETAKDAKARKSRNWKV